MLKNKIDELMQKCKYRIANASIIFISFTILLLTSCVSTSLSNNLDTSIKGVGNSIVFSWTDQHPFAQSYQSANIQLIAEYKEAGMNGRIRKVKQKIASSARAQSIPELNTKRFPLPETLKSIPETANICLYFSIQNRVVPIRSSNNGSESSRFAYPYWQQSVYSNTSDNFYKGSLEATKVNYQKAKEAEMKALSAPFNELSNFNAILKKENVNNMYNISKIEDCDKITIEPDTIVKTNDVLSQQKIPSIATNICTNASFSSTNSLQRYLSKVKTVAEKKRIWSWFKEYMLIPHALILPTIYQQEASLKGKGFFQSKSFSNISEIYNKFTKMVSNAQRYNQQTNAYNPSDMSIYTSKYTKDAGKENIYFNILGISKTPFTPAQLKEVVINEWAEITYCTFDMIKHLNTKRMSYKLNLVNAPKRAIASTKYFKNYCSSVFKKRENILKRFSQQRIKAEQKYNKLSNKLAQKTSSKNNNQSRASGNLNQNICHI